MSKISEDSSPPIRMEGFTFLSKLGAGATADVWLIQSKKSSQKYVIKIFNSIFCSDDDRFRFERECKSLCLLKHKNIVSLKKWGLVENIPWIIFSHVESLTLTAYLKKNQGLSVSALLKLFLQICDGIIYSHSHNIIHRDLKPDNILVDSENIPLIIDFGMAKSELINTVQTATGIVVGTPAYMDPQVIFAHSKASFHTDTYSLGIILYEMLTGITPFGGSNIGETVNLMARGEYRSVNVVNPQVPLCLSELVSGIIAPRVEARLLTTPLEVKSALTEYLSTQKTGDDEVISPFILKGESSKGRPAGSEVRPGGKKTLALKSVPQKTVPLKIPSQKTIPVKSQAKVPGDGSDSSRRWLRIVPLFTILLTFCGFFGQWLMEGRSDEIGALVDSGNYFNLGQLLISQGKYHDLEEGGAFVSLAGRVEGIKYLASKEPSKAMSIYLETLAMPTLGGTFLEEPLFQIIKPMLSSLLPAEISLFYEKLSNIYWFKNTGHQQAAIIAYGKFIGSLPPQVQALYKLRAFLFNCSNNDFSSADYELVLKEATELLTEAQTTFSSLPEFNGYFNTGFDKSFVLRYLQSMKTGSLFSELSFKNGAKKTGDELYEYRTRLPLTIALIAACHLELVEDVLGDRNRQKLQKQNISSEPGDSFIELSDCERKVAWNYLVPWFSGKVREGREPQSYLPIQLFPEEWVFRLANLGALAGKSELINDLSRFWLHNHPLKVDREGISLEFRGVAFTYNELRKLKWFSVEDSCPPIDNEYISKAMSDVFNEVTDIYENFYIPPGRDRESYLSFLFVYLIKAENFEMASVIYRKLLGEDKIISAHRFMDLLPHVRKLLESERHFDQLVKDEFIARTLKYGETLTDYPYVRSRICFMLLSASIEPIDFLKETQESPITEVIQETIGRKLRKSLVVRSSVFLRVFSDLQLGKAALFSRLNYLGRDCEEAELIAGSILIPRPETLSANDSLLYGWFLYDILNTASGTDVREFIKNELPEFRKWLLSKNPEEGHLLYYCILLQGLKRPEGNTSIETMAGGQEALAKEASDYMKANVQYMNKERLIYFSYFIAESFKYQEYEPVLELIYHHIKLVESSCSNLPKALVNFSLLQLAGGLTKHVIPASVKPQEARLRMLSSNDELIQNPSLRGKAIDVLESIYYGQEKDLPVPRWILIEKMSYIYLWLNDFQKADSLFKLYSIDDAPDTRKAALTERLIKFRIGLLNILEEKKAQENDVTKEIERIKELLKKYEKLPRHSSDYIKHAQNAIYNKAVRSIGLGIDL